MWHEEISSPPLSAPGSPRMYRDIRLKFQVHGQIHVFTLIQNHIHLTYNVSNEN